MPKISWTMKIIKKRHPKGLDVALAEAIFKAYSQWNRLAYDRILLNAPVSKTPNQRWPAGFVKGQIKLVTKKRGPYTYQEVDVPGKWSVGTRAWRAWVVIKTLHSGWAKLPFERRPTKKQALSFPVFPGARVVRPGQTRITVAKAIQESQITPNPWIKKTFESIEPTFPWILRGQLDIMRKARRKEVEEIK